MNWQPIETVPTTVGQKILLLSSEGIYQAEIIEKGYKGKWFKPLFLEYHGCGCCGWDWEDLEPPTHWAPIELPTN